MTHFIPSHKLDDATHKMCNIKINSHKICIPQGTHRKQFVKESHEGGLMGNFGVDKSLELLKEKFF